MTEVVATVMVCAAVAVATVARRFRCDRRGGACGCGYGYGRGCGVVLGRKNLSVIFFSHFI